MNNCTSAEGSGVAAPKPIPALSSSLTATATSSSAFSYTATSSTTGTTFAWSRAAVTGISNAAATGNGNISETLVNTTASPVNVTYVYTLTANGCTNTQNVVVTVGVDGSIVSPAVTTQPASQTKCAGVNVIFNSAASGSPAPTVQWQESTNGTTWNNITGATTGTLTFATTVADNNKQYRAVWTNIAGTATSNAATLTVNPIPAAPSVSVTNNCGSSLLTATGVPGATFLWSNGATTEAITVTTNGTYTVNQTVNNCTSAEGSGVAAPKPIPALSSSLTATATSSSAFSYTATSSTAGTTFAWSRAAVTGISNGAATGNGNISETLVNTTASPVNVTYVYTLTANGCTNTQNVVVTVGVDGSIVSPAVTTQPASQTRCAGLNASFSSAASGSPAPTVQWQVSTNGTTWTNITGATNATLSFATATADNNKQYRAVWTNSGGTVNSNAAILTVNSAPVAPVVTVVNNCGSSLFTASGYTGTLLWSNGATTASITVSTAGTYAVTQTVNGCTSPARTGIAAPKAIPPALNVAVANNCGNSILSVSGYTGSLLWSNGAATSSIGVNTAGTFTVTQTVNGCTSTPGSGTAAPKAIPSAPNVAVANNCGSSVLTATGVPGATFSWSTGATTESITVTINGTYTVRQTANNCISPFASATAAPKAIPSAPNVAVANNCGNSVLTATGAPGATFLWSTGASTSSITVTTAGTYTVTQTVNGCTSPLRSSVAAPKTIPALTSNLTAAAPVVRAFTYTATSSTAGTTFAWSRAAVTGISNAAATGNGNISETLVNTTTSPVNVTYVYTLTANGCTNTQNVVVTVGVDGSIVSPAVTTQPASQTKCAGVNVIFNSAASGSPAPTVQWQESTNGTTWNNITGATTGTLTFATTVADNNKQYRAVWTNIAGTANSNAATLTVNPIPAAPSVSVTNNCGSSLLTATGAPGATFSWSNGATTEAITVTTNGTYTVNQTVNNCTSAEGSGVAAPKPIPALTAA